MIILLTVCTVWLMLLVCTKANITPNNNTFNWFAYVCQMFHTPITNHCTVYPFAVYESDTFVYVASVTKYTVCSIMFQ